MRQMYKLTIMAGMLAVSLSACGKKSESGPPIDGQPWIGQPAPEFSLERYIGDTQTGDAVSLSDFRGRFVVLHFATSW